MKRLLLSTAFVLWMAAAAPLGQAWGQRFDRVKLRNGETQGRVASMTPWKVELNQGARKKVVEVNTITGISYGGEPSELTRARSLVLAGRYEEARQSLAKIDRAAVNRAEMQQDLKYYSALCDARLALAGGGDVTNAGKQMLSFVRANENSYHYLEACELLGDLLVARGNYARAESYYALLANAPWVDYKIRSAVLVGRAKQAQGQHAEAIAKFGEALAMGDQTEEANLEILSAKLGRANSLAATGKVAEAIQTIEEVIAGADPEQADLHARAYNMLGRCHLLADPPRTKDALLAYLHVDVLYNSAADAHAEALANLTKLWEEVGKLGRSREAAARLKQRYPNSRFAQ